MGTKHKEASGLQYGQQDAMEEPGGLIQCNHEVLPQRQRRKKKTRDAWRNDEEHGDQKIEGVGKRNRLLNEKEEAEVGQLADKAVQRDEDQVQTLDIKNVDARQKTEGSDVPSPKDADVVEKEDEYYFECTVQLLL